MDVFVAGYILSIVLFDGSIAFYASAALMVVFGIIDIFKSKTIPINTFVTMMLLFLLYNCVTLAIGVPVYPDVAKNRLFTVALNFVVNFILFSYLIDKDNRIRVMRWFVVFSCFLIAYIFVFNFSSVLKGRFGTGTPYLFGLRGISGNAYNSNTISKIIYLATIFVIYLRSYTKDKRKYNLLLMFILLLFLLLTGSRTGVLLLLSFVLLFYSFSSKKIAKKILSVFGGVLLVIVAYFLIMNIDFLYNIVGNRVEVLVKGVLEGGDYEAGTSVFYRNVMILRGLELFCERPFFGWGLDNFTKMSVYGTFSHSNFIELLVSCGIVGFSIYYLGYISLIKDSLIARKDPDGNIEACMFISYLIPMLVLNVATINYVDRLSLFVLYMNSAAVFSWNKGLKKKNLFIKFK